MGESPPGGIPDYPRPFPLAELRMSDPTQAPQETTVHVSPDATPSKGIQAIGAAAGSVAGTVGALAAATQGSPKVSAVLAVVSAILALFGAFSKAPNTVKVLK